MSLVISLRILKLRLPRNGKQQMIRGLSSFLSLGLLQGIYCLLRKLRITLSIRMTGKQLAQVFP